MDWLLLALSILFAIVQTTLFTKFSKGFTTNYERVRFIMISDVAAMLTILVIALISGRIGMPSGYTVLLGLLYGILTAVTYTTNMMALSCGPLSYTVLLTNFSMIIPTLSGRFFFGETVYILQYAGILLLLIAFYFIFNPEKNRALTLKWFLLTITTFVASGLVGIVQKVHQSSVHKDEIYSFLLIALAFASLIMLIMTYTKRGEKPEKSKKQIYIPLCFALLCGAFIGACNIINMYLSGAMDSALFFPLVNGVYIIGSGAVSVLFFKEKMNGKKIAAFIIGIVAIILIGNVIPLSISL